MARPLRIEYPGAVYHVTSRGNEKKPVFKDDPDRANFLVKTVLVVCVPGVQVPAGFLDEAAMQKFLESLSVAEERERIMAYERGNS